ncbi:hypothetical protein BU24DRAFT_423518 [Aaosphaeria arxii CBS 175.79]|uniref:Uncharacterized protein n=1 Tax=Aaosphaeria arxii CBS 175.79 TaxID=1450172 RepID=A0A6A5XNT6_9PLEO|nr:uncharacterized protein BU24DRAFT_423518 [Aaosphaeria arxii CBS 175.79]KAF2014603.1 hypothetical protein BU24DRAFT_423518 [Aaosphaeria arxii CBS 175.79]
MFTNTKSNSVNDPAMASQANSISTPGTAVALRSNVDEFNQLPMAPQANSNSTPGTAVALRSNVDEFNQLPMAPQANSNSTPGTAVALSSNVDEFNQLPMAPQANSNSTPGTAMSPMFDQDDYKFKVCDIEYHTKVFDPKKETTSALLIQEIGHPTGHCLYLDKEKGVADEDRYRPTQRFLRTVGYIKDDEDRGHFMSIAKETNPSEAKFLKTAQRFQQ